MYAARLGTSRKRPPPPIFRLSFSSIPIALLGCISVNIRSVDVSSMRDVGFIYYYCRFRCRALHIYPHFELVGVRVRVSLIIPFYGV